MTWDGIPEHRNLGGDGEPKNPLDALRDFLGGPPKPPPSMPADPFSGLAGPAAAQAEMIEAMRGAGLSEPSALLYVACLVQVGIAMQRGGLIPPEEP